MCILTHMHKHIHTLLVSVAPTKTNNGETSRQGCREGIKKKILKNYKKKTQFTGVHTAAQNINSIHPILAHVAPILSFPFLNFT